MPELDNENGDNSVWNFDRPAHFDDELHVKYSDNFLRKSAANCKCGIKELILEDIHSFQQPSNALIVRSHKNLMTAGISFLPRPRTTDA